MADRDVMDRDLEDGEISGSASDSEMNTSAATPVTGVTPPLPFGGQPFLDRVVVSYRSAGRASESSDSEPDSSEDEGASRGRKRFKVPDAVAPAAAGHLPEALRGRRVNNVWGSVVQEQHQDAVAAELGVFGMEGDVSMSDRNVETYNYALARKIMEKERHMERRGKGAGHAQALDAQLDEYMRSDGRERSGGGGDAKRKRPVKERLGPLAQMEVKGRYQIDEDDPEDKVVEEIAYRLQEPKKELIQRVVRVLGAKKAIDLLSQTATLEENGGVYTLDGSRRRTPGGVYLNLLKGSSGATRAQIREIFSEETQQEQKNKKAAQKRRRHLVAKKMKQAIGTLNLRHHDDVPGETFAGDAHAVGRAHGPPEEDPDGAPGEDPHEAPEEDPHEAPEEDPDEAPEEERAAGTEETPVVYNSADLEVF
ncbi:phosphorylated adapter RNA export protein [Stigmatopora nigra]